MVLSPSDGGGVVCVDGCCQAIVHVLLLRKHATAEVDSLHHAAGGHDAQHGVEEWVLWEFRFVKALRQCSARGHVHRQVLRTRDVCNLFTL